MFHRFSGSSVIKKLVEFVKEQFFGTNFSFFIPRTRQLISKSTSEPLGLTVMSFLLVGDSEETSGPPEARRVPSRGEQDDMSEPGRVFRTRAAQSETGRFGPR